MIWVASLFATFGKKCGFTYFGDDEIRSIRISSQLDQPFARI